MLISLVIPAFNEQKVIKNTITAAECFLKSNFGENKYEIIAVDDGSVDKTPEILAKSGVTVVSFPQNRGKGAAVREGILRSSGDFVFFTDADLPYSLDFLIEGVRILKSSDIVCGKRVGKGYPVKRRLISAAYNLFCSGVLGMAFSDVQCGIKGFSRRAATQIFSLCRIDGFAFDTEVLFLAKRLGYDTKTLCVRVSHRPDSSVRLFGDSIGMAADVFKIRNGFEAGEYNLQRSCQR
ncbi:MAG: Undecaprenyl-phosphate 4-deoxy-4-formamido-L-arabinose transferase [Firmicutes bacterium ADurb.Bin193]|nr:MAG: Undecaprenyl-phosphate 4-deoxy-4-formamido-L-arabinose transferase [Firmicutes bacterium ADurb.Bin193]